MRAKYRCEDCKAELEIEFEYVSELFNKKCDMCKSNNIYYTYIESNGIPFKVPGNGGCGRAG